MTCQRSNAELVMISAYYRHKNSVNQQWQDYLATRTPSEYIADISAYVADQRVAQYEQSIQAASAIDEHECLAAVGHLCPVCEPFQYGLQTLVLYFF